MGLNRFRFTMARTNTEPNETRVKFKCLLFLSLLFFLFLRRTANSVLGVRAASGLGTEESWEILPINSDTRETASRITSTYVSTDMEATFAKS